MMQLRKCCNHPYLIECPVEQETLLRKVDEELVTSCGKMLLLDRMLPELKRRGHKVLPYFKNNKLSFTAGGRNNALTSVTKTV